MKIFSAKQIYGADKFTIDKQNIASDELMERAAIGVFNWLDSRIKDSGLTIHIFCGIGNNGGDGLAVARHLLKNGYEVNVYIVNYSDKRSQDFLLNLDRLKEHKLWPSVLDAHSSFPNLNAQDIVIDAIFGIGLNRPPDKWVAQLISNINNSGSFTLSIDIPSGLFMAEVPKELDAIIRANYTLSFQFPKLIFFLPQTADYVGQWELINIGLDQEFNESTETTYSLIGPNEVIAMYRPRGRFSHKGDFGHTLVIGGSYGKIGAAILAANSSLNIGAGLVTAYIPKCGYTAVQAALPEVMVINDKEDELISEIQLDMEPEAVCLGMGLGQAPETLEAFEQFLKNTSAPLLIDADGLNLLAANKRLFNLLPKKTILTPHPGELRRLIGDWSDDFEKLEKAHEFSKKYHIILVIKGAYTMVIDGENGYINQSGNPGMATAGSGDVLSGVIAGLLSQGYSSLNAAIFGVYLHGLSGDLVAADYGYEAVTAKRISDYLGKAYIKLLSPPKPIGDNEEN